MASIISSASGYANYQLNKWKQEPGGAAFVKQQNDAAAQAEEQKEAVAKAAAEKTQETATATAEKQAATTTANDKFSVTRLIGKFAAVLFWVVVVLAAVGLTVMSGSILANHAWHLPTLLRMVYFLYGGLFFFLYLPYYYIYEVYVSGTPIELRAIVPIRCQVFTITGARWWNWLLFWMIDDHARRRLMPSQNNEAAGSAGPSM